MDKRTMWEHKTPGIPDELFNRLENVPITKEEIRSIIMGKLRLKEGSLSTDIGCGSGSISIEMAIQTKTLVYAIDIDKNAVDLTEQNLLKFGLEDRVKVFQGWAQELLPGLPNVDAIVIGGTTGDTEKIIGLAVDRLNCGGRLVVTSILIETAYKTLKAMEDSKLFDVDLIQVTVAKSKKTSTGTMMISRNPVMIFSATK
jgi:cobalt-precorrin-6B (C15)-methyltransferase